MRKLFKVLCLKSLAILGISIKSQDIYCDRCNDAYIYIPDRWVCKTCYDKEHEFDMINRRRYDI